MSHLINLADMLDKRGYHKLADAVDEQIAEGLDDIAEDEKERDSRYEREPYHKDSADLGVFLEYTLGDVDEFLASPETLTRDYTDKQGHAEMMVMLEELRKLLRLMVLKQNSIKNVSLS